MLEKYISKKVSQTLLFAAIAIPTQDQLDWKVEHFSKIPANQITFSKDGLLVRVKKSASPLIYPFKQKQKVQGFKIAGEFRGLPTFTDVAKQGEKGFDDFPLRIGFIVPGETRLTGLKKLFAPEWLKKLYEQVPSGLGLKAVEFYNVTQSPGLIKTSRTHPSSELIREHFFSLVKQPGPFSLATTFDKPIDAIGIWLSIDGDDTKSDFEVLIASIEI